MRQNFKKINTKQKSSGLPKQPESALLTAALSKKASVFALFGGMGTYKPFVSPFVQSSLFWLYSPRYPVPFLMSNLSIQHLNPISSASQSCTLPIRTRARNYEGSPTPHQPDKPTSFSYLPASRISPQRAEDFR